MDINTEYSQIKCGFLNVQSVGNKTVEIRNLINEDSLDILALAETWLGEWDKAKIQEMTPTTHTFLHVPRKGRRGGGVGIFVSNSFSKIKMEVVASVESFEHLQVSFGLGGRKFVIIVVYRPPSPRVNAVLENFLEEFRMYLETVDTVSANVFICGDFNFWLDDIDSYGVSGFIEMMDILHFSNKVDKVTSSTGHILDLVFCDTVHNLIQEVQVDDICCISPVHMLVQFKIPFMKDKKQRKKIVFRNKGSFDPGLLVDRVAHSISLEEHGYCLHGSREIRDCLNCFTNLYNSAAKREYNDMCPTVEKVIIVKDHAPWFNSDILKAKREKRRMEKRWRRLRTDAARREYQDARNRENMLVRNRRREYYRQKVTEAGSDVNKLYLVLHNLTGNKKKKKLPEGFSEEELANEFLEFFENKILNVVNSFAGSNLREESFFPEGQVNKMLHFRQVDIEKIKSIVYRVKLTYCDNDPIPMSDIIGKGNFSEFLDVFWRIVSLSIEHSAVPESEKSAIIKPVVKGSLDGQNLSSYRPVSNLTFLSKVIENVILDQLLEHLEKTHVLPDNQSAYRQLYSTETALCSVVNDLIILMDEGKCGVLILLDLSAAFDTVVHSLLLEDLKTIGIDGDALEYLRHYLENRTYSVQIGGSFSRTKSLMRGVPQGSVLGPILFCIYTIELSHLLKRHGVKFKLFADDTQFYLSIANVEDTEEKLDEIIGEIKKWMDAKQLKLNEDKTECLIVGRKGDLQRLGDVPRLRVQGDTMDVTESVKDLGVILDCNLSFNDQINKVVKVAGYHLRNIAFVKKYLDEHTIRMLIHNYVIGRLDYCNSIYYGLPNCQLKKLQSVINRAARLIRGLPPYERITPVLIDLHWLPIKARIVYKICVLTFQALRFGKPNYMRELLKDFQPETTMTLRHSVEQYRLEEPRCNLQVGFRSFEKSAPRLFNRLPEDVKASENTDVFKRRLKTFLFADCYELQGKYIKDDYKIN